VRLSPDLRHVYNYIFFEIIILQIGAATARNHEAKLSSSQLYARVASFNFELSGARNKHAGMVKLINNFFILFGNRNMYFFSYKYF